MKLRYLVITSIISFSSLSIYAMDEYLIEEKIYDSEVTYTAKNFPHTIEGEKSTAPCQKPQKAFSQKALQYVQQKQEKIRGQEKILCKAKPGKDGRKRIENTGNWPHSIFTKLSMTFSDGPYTGSGVIIGPQHILTCGHNVYTHGYLSNEWSSRIEAWPALNDEFAPFKKVGIVKAYTFRGWILRENENLDMALLILDTPIGLYTGWAGLLADSDEKLNYNYVNDGWTAAYKVTITGYPGDKGKSKGSQLWTMSHKLQALNRERFEYIIDTMPGQSGSPIWVDKNGGPLILGVHTNGFDLKKNPGANSGTRLSQKKFAELLVKYISETYELDSPFTNWRKKLSANSAIWAKPMYEKCNFEKITNLDLSNAEIGDTGTKHLAKGYLEFLNELNLTNNDVNNDGAKALATGNFPSLNKLILDHNKISNTGANALAAGKWISLTFLSLNSNYINEEGKESLKKGLTSLKTLNLNLDTQKWCAQGFY